MTATKMVKIPSVLVVALMAAACRAAPTAVPEWVRAEEPLFEVGGFNDAPEYALSEVVGATRLDDGRVVIADRLWYGLKLYSAGGDFLKGVGGEGQGPGEFEYIRGIGRCAAGRVTAFDLDWDENHYSEELDFLGTRAARNEMFARGPYQSACNENGFVLATGWGDLNAEFVAGYYVATAPVRLSKDGEVVHDFGERLSSERVGTLRPDGSPAGSGPHPFGRQTSVALGATRAYLGDAADYVIEVYDLTGRRQPDIRWVGPDLALTPEDFTALGEEAVAAAPPSDQARVRRRYRDMPKLERIPAYDRLLTDTEGNLWVRYFPRPRAESLDWIVFSPEGVRVGAISLPLRTTVLEVGSDYLLVAEHDDFDVPSVRVYALQKSHASDG